MAQRMNLREQVLNELGQAIARGELSPGDRLPNEADLGEEYGVSRTVVREAIKGLAARGLVASRSRVGTVVCARDQWKLLDPDVLSWTFQSDPSSDVLWKLTETRLVVEPVAAKWAAERADADEKDRIERCFKHLEEAVGQQANWIQADVAFHDSILMACHNELIVNLVRTLRGALHESREATVMIAKQHGARHGAATQQALELHREPYEAIMEGDGDRAHEGMQAVIRWVLNVIRSHRAGA
jgi:DNA-binding FadR family transcriptional regulator